MSGCVYVHEWASLLGAGSRENRAAPWRDGLTIADLVPLSMGGRAGLTAHHNGVPVPAERWPVTRLSPEDHVDWSVRPHGIEAVTAALISAAVSAGISFVVSLILPKPKGPKKRGDEESATYAWQRSDNVRVEGQPRHVIYGEIRVAPQILDEFVRTTAVPPQSDLYLLLGLGEGPIESIGDRATDSPAGEWLTTPPRGIEIESNNAQNFNGVLAQVRLGTREQEPLLDFQQIHTLSTVGQTLDQLETTATTNSGTAWSLTSFPYNSNAAAVQAIWDEYAQGFDLTQAADSIVCTVDFPEGLYRLDTAGALQDAYFQALIRYRELDGFGVPITTGGDNGDGWVYVQPVQPLVARHQGPFPYELSATLYSSAGFTPGAPGRVLSGAGGAGYAYTSATNGGAAANLSTPWSAGTDVDAFTFEGWVEPDYLQPTGGDAIHPICEWMTNSGGQVRGISIAIARKTTDGGGVGGPQQKYRLAVSLGSGAAAATEYLDLALTGIEALQSNFTVVRWYHVAAVYQRNATPGVHQLRLYIDGQLVKTHNVTGLRSTSAPMYLTRTILANPGIGGVRMDEARAWSTARTAAQIAQSFNGGLGQYGTTSPDLIAGWHFDLADSLVNFSFSNDYGPRNNDVTSAGGATMGDSTTGTGVVYAGGAGTRKRARYRVQLMRFNLKSSSTYIGDRSEWSSIDGIVEEELAYPNTPILALKIPATDQLNTSTPRVTVLPKGRKVPVWDGVSVAAPTFTERWSANPAWCALDMLMNRRYGRAGEYEVDLPSLKDWADYCDGLIYDGRGSTSIHSTTSSVPISNLRYDSTLFSGFGGIEISFRTGFTPPIYWRVGEYVGFVGVAAPPTSGLNVDINIGNIAGFEIGSMTFASSAWTVAVKYDTATYGAPWLDGAFLSAVINPTAVTGTVQGREVRFRFDGIFDTFGKFWDQLLLLCGTARCTPVLEGRRIRFKVARPRSPVGMVTHASILPGSFKISYTGRSERPNSITADFLDADRNWQRATAERLAASVEETSPEGAFNRENVELFGITRRSQVLRDLGFRLNVNDLLVRQGEFRVGLQALPYESGDVVVLAPDLVPWGVGGRFDVACSGTTMKLDRAVTLAAATTYYLMVRSNAAGQTGSGTSAADFMETREVTATAGTYAAGASISIASAFSINPAPDDEYVLYTTAQRRLAEIAEITLEPDYTRRVKWIEYRDDTYDVDTLPQDLPQELQFAVNPPRSTPDMLPAPVLDLSVRQQETRDASGSWAPELRASWRLDPDTASHVAEVAIYARPDAAGAFAEVARVRGPATSAVLRAPWMAVGQTIEVAVQPITVRGRRAAPLLCARALAAVSGLSVPPPAPTNLRAVLDGDQVTYLWDPPENARGLSFELRRGGWVLGQVVGIAPSGSRQLGPMPNWAASKDNARGDGPPPLLLRSRDGRGHYSAAAVLKGFNPSVPGSTVLVPPNVLGKRINGDTRWEDYGTGWAGGSPATTLTNVEVHTLVDGRKALRLAGSALTGTFETAVGTIDLNTKPERAYVEAFATADQVAPITADEELLGADDPLASRRTAEGVIASLPEEPGTCTAKIEWRYKIAPADSYTEWSAFTPGIYSFVSPQFRLTLTRPDTSFNALVYSFGTRISRPPLAGLLTDSLLAGTASIGSVAGVQQPVATHTARSSRSWISDPGAATVSNLGFAAAPVLLGTAASGPATNRNMVTFTTAASIGAIGGITPAAYTYTRRAYRPTLVQTIRTQSDITSVCLWAGLFSADPTASSTPTGHVAAFRYATDVDGTAFWRCITRDGTTANTTTTTTAIATGTEYVLRIEADASRVEFWIDDVLVAEHTANLPGSTQTMSPVATVTALAAAARGIRWGSTTLLQAA